jgi:membrane protease YdiL (CAAX protease family)
MNPQETGAKPYPGFWQGLGILGENLLATVVPLLPFLLLDKLKENPAVLAMASLLGTAWVLMRYRSRTGIEADEVAGRFDIPLITVLPIAGVVFGLLLAETPILLWLMHLAPSLNPKEDYGMAESVVGSFLLVVVTAPVSEELLFRGILLRGFAGRYGDRIGILLSATLFALMHVHAIKLLSTFLLGVLLAWLTLRLGSIWPGMMAHTMNNLLAFLAGYYSETEGAEQTLPVLDPLHYAMIPAGIALAFAGFSSLRRSPMKS